MSLFNAQPFTSSAGLELLWKLECDEISPADWRNIAAIVAPHLHFSNVEGVPRGGLPFAAALEPYKTEDGGPLIVDDVLTTGRSMEVQRGARVLANGLVLFARGPLPSWVRAVLVVPEWLR